MGAAEKAEKETTVDADSASSARKLLRQEENWPWEKYLLQCNPIIGNVVLQRGEELVSVEASPHGILSELKNLPEAIFLRYDTTVNEPTPFASLMRKRIADACFPSVLCACKSNDFSTLMLALFWVRVLSRHVSFETYAAHKALLAKCVDRNAALEDKRAVLALNCFVADPLFPCTNHADALILWKLATVQLSMPSSSTLSHGPALRALERVVRGFKEANELRRLVDALPPHVLACVMEYHCCVGLDSVSSLQSTLAGVILIGATEQASKRESIIERAGGFGAISLHQCFGLFPGERDTKSDSPLRIGSAAQDDPDVEDDLDMEDLLSSGDEAETPVESNDTEADRTFESQQALHEEWTKQRASASLASKVWYALSSKAFSPLSERASLRCDAVQSVSMHALGSRNPLSTAWLGTESHPVFWKIMADGVQLHRCAEWIAENLGAFCAPDHDSGSIHSCEMLFRPLRFALAMLKTGKKAANAKTMREETAAAFAGELIRRGTPTLILRCMALLQQRAVSEANAVERKLAKEHRRGLHVIGYDELANAIPRAQVVRPGELYCVHVEGAASKGMRIHFILGSFTRVSNQHLANIFVFPRGAENKDASSRINAGAREFSWGFALHGDADDETEEAGTASLQQLRNAFSKTNTAAKSADTFLAIYADSRKKRLLLRVQGPWFLFRPLLVHASKVWVCLESADPSTPPAGSVSFLAMSERDDCETCEKLAARIRACQFYAIDARVYSWSVLSRLSDAPQAPAALLNATNGDSLVTFLEEVLRPVGGSGKKVERSDCSIQVYALNILFRLASFLFNEASKPSGERAKTCKRRVRTLVLEVVCAPNGPLGRVWKRPAATLDDPRDIFASARTDLLTRGQADIVFASAKRCISAFVMSSPRRVLNLLLQPSIILASLHHLYSDAETRTEALAQQITNKVFEYIDIVCTSDSVTQPLKTYCYIYLLAFCSNLYFKGMLFDVCIPKRQALAMKRFFLGSAKHWRIVLGCITNPLGYCDDCIRASFIRFLNTVLKSAMGGENPLSWIGHMLKPDFSCALLDAYAGTENKSMQTAVLEALLSIAKSGNGRPSSPEESEYILNRYKALAPHPLELEILWLSVLWQPSHIHEKLFEKESLERTFQTLSLCTGAKHVRTVLLSMLKCASDDGAPLCADEMLFHLKKSPTALANHFFSCLTWHVRACPQSRSAKLLYLYEKAVEAVALPSLAANANSISTLTEFCCAVQDASTESAACKALLRAIVPIKSRNHEWDDDDDDDVDEDEDEWKQRLLALNLSWRLCEAVMAAEKNSFARKLLSSASTYVIASHLLLADSRDDSADGKRAKSDAAGQGILDVPKYARRALAFLAPYAAASSQEDFKSIVETLRGSASSDGCQRPPLFSQHAVDLSKCGLQPGMVSNIVSAMRLFDIRKIVLFGNNIGSKGAIKIAAWLKDGSCALEHVDLARNGIEADGVAALGDSLRKNKTLRIFNLAENNISNNDSEGDTGLISLAESLLWNKTLLALDLSASCLSSKGLISLTKALRYNKVLLFLDLSNTVATRNQLLAVAFKTSANMDRAKKEAKETVETSVNMNILWALAEEAKTQEKANHLSVLEGKCGVS